ncbi:MarC family transcriptional regulator [Kaistia algarum]|uniref:MarC family protein n=1 Tax=Kaistia algarum TaxID=2083279 RepID=UPI000CE9254F|nr:MarC family protein [Kaistia algarum]MCX5515102.1 MarC family protein [Kaistia algarum]PPE79830.1 MarC family transcriptional regulator [Kaistia algarum]
MADYWLNALVTLFVTLDPIGLAPIFVGLTRGMTKEQRRQTGFRATLTAAAILFVFALGGQGLLNFLGISLSAFRIAGGLLLFWIAFEMVFERRDKRKQTSADRALGEEAMTGEDVRHIAVFPLAIPLISGPGAISATILTASSAPNLLALIGLLVIIAALIGSCLVVFLLAGPLDRALGETGRIVLTRLLGVLLAALSVQFVADGVVAIAKAATQP